MIHRVAGILVACLAVTVFGRADDAASRESRALEGEWRAIEAERDDQKSTSDEVKNLRMVFRGDELTIKSGDGAGRPRLKKFKLDPDKSPKAIDITSLDGQERGQTQACIYTVDKGRLVLCMPYAPTINPEQRPLELKTKPGDGLMLLILERVQPK